MVSVDDFLQTCNSYSCIRTCWHNNPNLQDCDSKLYREICFNKMIL